MVFEYRFELLRRIGIGVMAGLLFALLAWLTLSSRQAEHAQQAAQAQEVQTLSILRATDAVLKAAQDAETGQRGFILTGDRMFLQPLDAARRSQPRAIAHLRDLTLNEPEPAASAKRIEELALTRMAQVDRSLALVAQGQLDQARSLSYLRDSKQTMDSLRTAISELELAKQAELVRTREDALHYRKLAGRWRALLTVFTVVLGLLCGAAVLGQLRTRRQAREQAIVARSETILKAGRHLLQSIIDSSENLIFVKTRRGEVLFANTAFTSVIPTPFPDLYGVPLPPTDDPQEAEALAAADRAALERGERNAVDLRLTVGGKRCWYRVEKNPWVRDGKIIGVIGIVRDISDTKQREAGLEQRVAARTTELESALTTLQREMAEREAAQETLRQLQKIESLGQLTGGIAHDFNNMLAVVISSLDTARHKLADGDVEPIVPLVETALAGATSAADLTGRLLAFARRQKLSPAKVEINALVERTRTLLARSLGSSIEVKLELDPAAGWVEVDNSQLENALINLAVNARDAMPHGGRLTIASSGQAGKVKVTVTDTGEGMTSEQLAQVFDPFFTTKPVGLGTGLGLSQVHGFVAQSGGQIEIQSEPGKGTKVTIELPACDPPTQHTQSATDFTATPGCGEQVLVAEDEALVRLSAKASLQALGYQVLTAADGYAALALIEQHPDIDVLLTDVSMPGMDGRDLAHAAQLLRPDIAVVLTTGHELPGAAADGMPVLVKPYLLDQLASAITQALASVDQREPAAASLNSTGDGGPETQAVPTA